MDIDSQEVLDFLTPLNADEQFYKEYYLVGKSPTSLKAFLSKIDREDAIKRHLVIPELLPDIISYEMNDDEYFNDEDNRSIFISPHNRYTPAFMHRHNFFEIIYVYSGFCFQNIGLKRLYFKEGDVIFIAPGVFHTMEVFSDDTLVFNILLRKSTFHQMFLPLTIGNDLINEFFSQGLYSFHQLEYLIFHTRNVESDFLLKMYYEQLHYDMYSNQILTGMFTTMNAKMMRYFKDTIESSCMPNSIHLEDNFMVLNYIQDNLEDISLQDVANHFGFSISYCSRLIKNTTGVGFNDWKRTIRIRKAEHMLLNTKKSVSDIGASLGYINPETFIRAFKREIHLTPSQYRKQIYSKK